MIYVKNSLFKVKYTEIVHSFRQIKIFLCQAIYIHVYLVNVFGENTDFVAQLCIEGLVDGWKSFISFTFNIVTAL